MRLSKLIAPSFYEVHQAIKEGQYTHYWLKGGRGSTKSSFVGIEIILGMMRDSEANAVALRKVKDTLRESVFEQLLWAIDILGVRHLWKDSVSPLGLTFIPTGQRIIFRGADNPKKVKSAKLRRGYIKYIWYEEVDEFGGPEEIRTINQTFMRGGDEFAVVYTFNPPKSQRNWVNREVQEAEQRLDTLVHHSTYLTVPREWLGDQFVIEAEHLKKANPTAYAHEYLGEITGTGGEVFTNLTIRRISDDEINTFDRLNRGIDWGYAVDPFHYTVNYFDKTRRRLYIFHEIHKVGLSNRKAAEMVKTENKRNQPIICDSAEPKSIAEFRSYGINVQGAKKGPDSVDYGIKFLQDLEEIVIDPVRCPNTAREFQNYELDRDQHGEFIARYPDRDNHSIDAIRYSLEPYIGAPRELRTGHIALPW